MHATPTSDTVSTSGSYSKAFRIWVFSFAWKLNLGLVSHLVWIRFVSRRRHSGFLATAPESSRPLIINMATLPSINSLRGCAEVLPFRAWRGHWVSNRDIEKHTKCSGQSRDAIIVSVFIYVMSHHPSAFLATIIRQIISPEIKKEKRKETWRIIIPGNASTKLLSFCILFYFLNVGGIDGKIKLILIDVSDLSESTIGQGVKYIIACDISSSTWECRWETWSV